MTSNARENRLNCELKLCECGCGEEIRAFDKYDGTPRRIKNGHQNRFFTQQGKYKVPRPERRGVNNPRWKGGRIIDRKGYVRIRVPDYPNSYRGYVLEHRYVMEQHLGHYLTKEEDVHHINGNKQDNRIENLQLLTHSKHSTHSNLFRGLRTIGRHCLICNGTESINYYRNTTCWLTNPITKERWICWRCYKRVWRQMKKV